MGRSTWKAPRGKPEDDEAEGAAVLGNTRVPYSTRYRYREDRSTQHIYYTS